MMAADALRCTVPSGVSLCWLSPRRRACSARAFAPHFALPAAPPGRKCPQRQRRAEAEGKIKGRGTGPLGNLVCTWGWRGTRQRVIACCEGVQYRFGIGESACFVRWAAMALDGGVP